MRRAVALMVAALTVLTAMPGAAQDPGNVLESPRTRLVLLLPSRIGVAKTPFAAPLWPEQTGYRVFTFVPEASYALDNSIQLRLRVPFVEAFVERPAGSIVKEAALGNVELSVSWERLSSNGLHGALGLSVGAPSEGSITPERSHYSNAALALGSALEGWRHPELFGPGRLPLTPSARFDYRARWFRAGLELKVPLLVQLQTSHADSSADVHPVAITPVFSANAALNPLGWLYVGARSWIAWQAVAPVALREHRPSSIQVAVQPELTFALGGHVALTLDSILPIGGELGGNVYSGALTLCVRF